MTNLAACPFCGATPTLEDHRTIWVVICTCGCSMLGERAPEPEYEMGEEYWKRFEQSAIDRWNRRAVEPTPSTESQCGDCVNLNGVDWVCTKPADHREHNRHPVNRRTS